MRQPRLLGALGAALALAVLIPAGAGAQPPPHQCQKPVRSGVEVYDLHDITAPSACPVALELFAWEYSSDARTRALYGCHRPRPEAEGYPYLRLHRFRGWRLSLRGPGREFTMSRGRSSFEVSGADFPLNCT